MLYDPKWEVQTKADPFQLGTLIAWLEKQPANETYCYMSHGQCLLAQYFRAMGFDVGRIGGFSVILDGEKIFLPQDFSNIPLFEPRTFGGALARARKFADLAE